MLVAFVLAVNHATHLSQGEESERSDILIDLSISLNTRPLLRLSLSRRHLPIPPRLTPLPRNSQVGWGDRQEGGEGRELGGKVEDNMYRKRKREGVWSSYIYNNVSIISLP